MIICEFMASEGEGGLENHFHDVVEGLAINHTVHVIANESQRKRFSSKVVFHSLNLTRSRNNILLWLELLRIIKKISPEVLHVHANKASYLVSKIKFLLRCPVVATVHSLKRNVSMYSKLDALIAVSNDVLKPINHDRSFVVYNGRNIEKYKPKESNKNSNVLYKVLMVGRLVDVKRVDVAIDAISKVSNAELLIAGEGSCRQKLEDQVSSLGIKARVKFLGFREDVNDLMRNADLIIISSDREGFPLVMVEALLLNKLIVSTKVPGANEFIPSSYLAEIGSPDSLADKINSVLLNVEKSNQDFQPVWERAASELTLEAQIKRTENVLKLVVNG